MLADCDFDDPNDRLIAERLMGFYRDGQKHDGHSESASVNFDGHRRAARDVYFNLIRDVQSGKIRPVRSAFHDPHTVNPFRTDIRLQDLLDLASSRGDGGEIVRALAEGHEAPPRTAARGPKSQREHMREALSV